MCRDAVAHADADGAELAARRPHAAAARVALRDDAGAAGDVDHDLLESPDERPHAEAALGEPDDRIDHQLSGRMVRRKATALDAVTSDAATCELGVVDAQISDAGAAAERDRCR